MKKLVLALALALCPLPVQAGCTVGAVPFVFQNNTIADATQVNANFNQIISAVAANCAALGSNTDITSIGGLTTPLAPAFGGTSNFNAGTSTGTANAQVVAPTTPAIFSLTVGYRVRFTAVATNTGAMTLQVAGTPATNVFRQTQLGVQPMVGGEVVAGLRVEAEYDGTQFQLIGDPYQVGKVFDWAGTACPPGSFNANNQTILRTGNTAALFSVLGTTWGVGDGSTTFNVPDLRARATYGQDQNVGGLSNRITVAGANFNGAVIGAAGGLQNHTMALAELAVHNHGITDPGHGHTGIPATAEPIGGGASSAVGGSGGSTNTNTTGITVNNAGSSTPFTVLGPAIIMTKCVQG